MQKIKMPLYDQNNITQDLPTGGPNQADFLHISHHLQCTQINKFPASKPDGLEIARYLLAVRVLGVPICKHVCRSNLVT